MAHSLQVSRPWKASSFSAIQEIPPILWTWLYITVFTRAFHWSRHEPDESIPQPHITFVRYILVLCYHWYSGYSMVTTLNGWAHAQDRIVLSSWQIFYVMSTVFSFWVVALFLVVSSSKYFRGLWCHHEGLEFPWDFRNYWPRNTLSHSRTLGSSATPLWELHIQHCSWCLCVNCLIYGSELCADVHFFSFAEIFTCITPMIGILSASKNELYRTLSYNGGRMIYCIAALCVS